MVEIFTNFFDWMAGLPVLWMYVTILGVAYFENVIPPIPGDMVVVFGGYLVGVGTLNFSLVVILSTIGGALGFMTMYAIGYRMGEAAADPKRLRWLPKTQIAEVTMWLEKWGMGLIAANRFLSGTRSVISLTVGMARMKSMPVLLYSTLSALIWTFLLVLAGYLVGDNWEIIGGYLKTYGRIILGVVVVLVGIWIFRRYRQRQANPSASSKSNSA